MVAQYQQITANLAGTVRREVVNGREYLVAPLSMLVPGVLNGSRGPLFYSPEETSRNVDAWNGMPIVVNHPVDNSGNPISARTPYVTQKYRIGTVYNARFDSKLGAEGWFDVEDTRRVDVRVLQALEAGTPIELSTGLYTKNEPVKNGEYNGRSFVAVARDHKPDHLAILPDKRGACSIYDGCGVNINELSEEELAPYKLDWDQVENSGSLTDAELAVKRALKDRFGDETPVINVYPNEVVFLRYGKLLVKLPYTINESTYEVTLNEGEPVAVRKVTEYRPVSEEAVTNGKNWWELIDNAFPSTKLEMSPAKAQKILDDGEVNGKPLTDEQRKMFGAIASKAKKKKTNNASQSSLPEWVKLLK